MQTKERDAPELHSVEYTEIVFLYLVTTFNNTLMLTHISLVARSQGFKVPLLGIKCFFLFFSFNVSFFKVSI